MEAPLITDTVSHYTVLKKLGVGGRTEDYLAGGTVLNRRLVKFLPDVFASDQQPKRHLLQKAQAAGLEHANIRTIHEVGEDAGRSFVVIGYSAGETKQEYENQIETMRLIAENSSVPN